MGTATTLITVFLTHRSALCVSVSASCWIGEAAHKLEPNAVSTRAPTEESAAGESTEL